MKSFFDLREAVKSADKKPETYIGPDGKPKIRMVPVDRTVIKTEQAEDDMPASPDEKSMALKQAKFIEYVAGEIEEYLEKNKSFPEWMQNKLSALHEKAKDMHAVLAGDYDDEEDEMKEAYISFKTADEKKAFEDGKKAARSGKKYADNPHKDEKQKLAWSKGHNQSSARKLGVREEKDPRIKAAGVSGYNKPKATPGHPQKSHIVVAKDGDKVKTIRFGQAGVTTAGAPKEGESEKQKSRRKSFKARHADNIAKGKMSAAYWADKVKW
jgi:hypothetical protein